MLVLNKPFNVSDKKLREEWVGLDPAKFTQGVHWVLKPKGRGKAIWWREDIPRHLTNGLGGVELSPEWGKDEEVEDDGAPSSPLLSEVPDDSQMENPVVKALEQAFNNEVEFVPVKSGTPTDQVRVCRVIKVHQNTRWVDVEGGERVYVGLRGARKNQMIRVKNGSMYLGK